MSPTEPTSRIQSTEQRLLIGRIIDDSTREGAAGLTLWLAGGPAGSTLRQFAKSTVTDAEGRFEIEYERPADWTVCSFELTRGDESLWVSAAMSFSDVEAQSPDFILPVPIQQPEEQSAPSTIHQQVAGRVVDQASQVGIAGLTLVLAGGPDDSHMRQVAASSVTDSDGRFEIEYERPADWTVCSFEVKRGAQRLLQTQNTSFSKVEAQSPDFILEVSIQQPAQAQEQSMVHKQVSGRVVEQASQVGIAGLTLVLAGGPDSSTLRQFAESAITDSEGRFEIEYKRPANWMVCEFELTRGDESLWISADMSFSDVEARSPDFILEVPIQQPDEAQEPSVVHKQVSGRVVDQATKVGVAGLMLVLAGGPDDSHMSQFAESTVTDTDGRFEIQYERPVDWTVCAFEVRRGDQSLWHSPDMSFSEVEVQSPDFILPVPIEQPDQAPEPPVVQKQISGRVVDQASQVGIAGLTLWLAGGPDASHMRQFAKSTVTDAEGRFEIEYQRQADWTVCSFEVLRGDEHLWDEHLWNSENMSFSEVEAQSPNFVLQVPIQPNPQLQEASPVSRQLSGRVIDRTTQRGIPGLTVRLVARTLSDGKKALRVDSSLTDDDGYFSIHYQRPGTDMEGAMWVLRGDEQVSSIPPYRDLSRVEAESPYTFEVDIEQPDQAPEPSTIHKQVSGRVVDQARTAAAGFTLVLSVGDEPSYTSLTLGTTVTDSEGRFTIEYDRDVDDTWCEFSVFQSQEDVWHSGSMNLSEVEAQSPDFILPVPIQPAEPLWDLYPSNFYTYRRKIDKRLVQAVAGRLTTLAASLHGTVEELEQWAREAQQEANNKRKEAQQLNQDAFFLDQSAGQDESSARWLMEQVRLLVGSMRGKQLKEMVEDAQRTTAEAARKRAEATLKRTKATDASSDADNSEKMAETLRQKAAERRSVDVYQALVVILQWWNHATAQMERGAYSGALTSYATCTQAIDEYAHAFAFADSSFDLNEEPIRDPSHPAVKDLFQHRHSLRTLEALEEHDWHQPVAAWQAHPDELGSFLWTNDSDLAARRSLWGLLPALYKVFIPLAQIDAYRLAEDIDVNKLDKDLRNLNQLDEDLRNLNPLDRALLLCDRLLANHRRWHLCEFIEVPFIKILKAQIYLEQADRLYRDKLPEEARAKYNAALAELGGDSQNDEHLREFEEAAADAAGAMSKQPRPIALSQPTHGVTGPLVDALLLEAKVRIRQIAEGRNYLGYSDDYVPYQRFQALVEKARAEARDVTEKQVRYVELLKTAEAEEFAEKNATQAMLLAEFDISVEEARTDVRLSELKAAEAARDVARKVRDNAQRRLDAYQAFDARADIEHANIVSELGEARTMAAIGRVVEGGLSGWSFGAGQSGSGAKAPTGAAKGSSGAKAPTGAAKGSSGANPAQAVDKGSPGANPAQAVATAAGTGFALAGPLGAVAGALIGGVLGWMGSDSQKDIEESQLRIAGAQREYEKKSLALARDDAQAAIAVPEAQIKVAQKAFELALLEKEAARLRHQFAEKSLNYVKNERPLKAETWYRLAYLVKQQSRRELEIAIWYAFRAERAYEFEFGEKRDKILFNYEFREQGDKAGAGKLEGDLQALEKDAEEKRDGIRTRWLPEVDISLARDFPNALQELRTSRETSFTIPLEMLERPQPGWCDLRVRSIQVAYSGTTIDRTPFHVDVRYYGDGRLRRVKAEPDKDAPPDWLGPQARSWPVVWQRVAEDVVPLGASSTGLYECRLLYQDARQAETGPLAPLELCAAAATWGIKIHPVTQFNPANFHDVVLRLCLTGSAEQTRALEALIEGTPRPPLVTTAWLSGAFSPKQTVKESFQKFRRTGQMTWTVDDWLLSSRTTNRVLRNAAVLLLPAANPFHFSPLMSNYRVDFEVSPDGTLHIQDEIPRITFAINGLTLDAKVELDGGGTAKWSFLQSPLEGDGKSSSQQSREPEDWQPISLPHTFPAPGRYEVKLTVQGRPGRRSEYRALVLVPGGGPAVPPLTVYPRLEVLKSDEGLRLYGEEYHVGSDTAQKIWTLLGNEPSTEDLSIPLKPGKHSISFTFIRPLTARFYSTQRPLLDERFEMTQLRMATDREFDDEGNERNADWRNSLANHLFGGGDFGPEGQWTLELTADDNPFLRSTDEHGKPILDLSDIGDAVLNLEYEADYKD